jgi:hypothetical protein
MHKLALTLAAGFALLVSSNAMAVVILNPLTYATDGLVGTVDPLPGSADVDTVRGYGNTILALGLGATSTVDGVTYKSNTDIDYSGVLVGGVRVNTGDGSNIPAGYDYVMAKYDGQNAGWVLFFIGGEASSIPDYPWNLWTTNDDQYRLSNYTLFNRTQVSEPGTIALLGLGILAIGLALRKRVR